LRTEEAGREAGAEKTPNLGGGNLLGENLTKQTRAAKKKKKGIQTRKEKWQPEREDTLPGASLKCLIKKKTADLKGKSMRKKWKKVKRKEKKSGQRGIRRKGGAEGTGPGQA